MKLIEKIKNFFKKKEEKVVNPFEKKLFERVKNISKELLERVEGTRNTDNEVKSNDILIFDKEQQKVVSITGEKKKNIVKKVQIELAKNPDLFVSDDMVKEPVPEPKTEKPKRKYTPKNRKPKN